VLALSASAGAGEPGPAAPAGLAATLAAEPRDSLVADVTRLGDARRGSTVFHTRHLTCVQCHVAGAGASPLGPNLAAMPPGVSREKLVAHLVESILDPSAVIRPEYRGVTIVTSEGRSLTGLVERETDDDVVIREASATGATAIAKADIDERVPATRSLMPTGLASLLADRGQFLDLVRYLAEIAAGGAERAAALPPDPSVLAAAQPAAYEATIDHAGFLAEWGDRKKARQAFRRGEAIYARVCANCHGTLEAPGSLPTALRFAEGKFKHGGDPYSMYRTLTAGAGLMVAQGWMVPTQKYDVIHYIREAFLKERNREWYTAITPEYLAGLPRGTSRGPAASTIEPWRLHDYGPFLAGTFEVAGPDAIARKGLVMRLDAGPGGVGRGHAWVLHELDTMRVAAFWTGDAFIDWAGINFDGRHGRHPRIVGDVQAGLATMPGWANPRTGSFDDPRPHGRDDKPYGPLPRDHVRFRALHHAAADGASPADPRSVVVLDTVVGATPVLETDSLAAPLVIDGRERPVLVRSFSFGPRPQPLVARLAAAPAAAAIVGRPSDATDDTVPRVVATDAFVELRIPAGDAPLDIAVAVAAADPAALGRHAVTLALPPAPRTLVGRPAPPLWPTILETTIVPGSDADPFAADTLTAPDVNPWNAQLRFSGIDFLDADTAVLCTWDGDVWTARGITAASGRLAWRRIASGLFQPLGIKVIDGAIRVACRDRIVTLVDLDGDGLTDRYDTFNDDHQVTEHFHEFAMGLETDAAGNLYYAKSARHALPAVVPHHGTLLRVSRDGSSTEIVATGFRAANGVCIEPDGTFWVTDQEGHWNPKNRINHVRPGGFYGNMFGYHDVTDSSDAAMDPPAVWITNAFDRSPAELLRVTSPRWEPLTGGLLELSYGEGRIHLVLTEPVAGRPGLVQGGMVRLPLADLPTGIMRGRFHPDDGQLYACGLYAWAGNRTRPGGFYRVRRTAAPLVMPVRLHAETGTIVLTFSSPLDRDSARRPTAWRVSTWGLRRTAKYGSDHVDENDREVAAAEVSSDGRQVTLRVPGFGPTWCYALAWDVSAAAGAPVQGVLHGTFH
jgi:putative heme-binding domain-containing protein